MTKFLPKTPKQWIALGLVAVSTCYLWVNIMLAYGLFQGYGWDPFTSRRIIYHRETLRVIRIIQGNLRWYAFRQGLDSVLTLAPDANWVDPVPVSLDSMSSAISVDFTLIKHYPEFSPFVYSRPKRIAIQEIDGDRLIVDAWGNPICLWLKGEEVFIVSFGPNGKCDCLEGDDIVVKLEPVPRD